MQTDHATEQVTREIVKRWPYLSPFQCLPSECIIDGLFLVRLSMLNALMQALFTRYFLKSCAFPLNFLEAQKILNHHTY